MSKKYIAECFGTFGLAFLVLAAVGAGAASPLVVPVVAALTLGLFVYTIGSISGAHINPAITIGLLSVKKITQKDAAFYVIAQILGAVLAIVAGKFFMLTMPVPAPGAFDVHLFAAEALGACLFAFGVATVARGGVSAHVSGIVVGGSLLLGVLASSLAGAAGILNPAVALALNAVTAVYIIAPIVGAVIGFQLQQYLTK